MNDQDIAYLREVLRFNAANEAMSESVVETVRKNLTLLQSKLDLSKVALMNFHLRRIPDLAEKIKSIQEQIWNSNNNLRIEGMEVSDIISLLKEMNRELEVAVKYIDQNSSRPTISSPDNMTQPLNDEIQHPDEVQALPPESRRKIVNMLDRLHTKIQVIEAETV